ncbi:MAG: MBL fold metallo-hydrolase [Pseudomonadota bacterium]
MELEFFGAAGEVTGSCHILRCNGRTLLLDCGMIQGGRTSEVRNAKPFPFDAAAVDAVVLSHAHIDHSGRLPLLVKRGFRGPIHAHNATCDLAEILLEDAARLAASQSRRANERRARRDEAPIEPLFDLSHAQAAHGAMVGHRYREFSEVMPGVRLRFHDAGHIMGSCIVELQLEEGGQTRRLVFSGDLGQWDTPILNDPELLETADLVLMESTYGSRRHRDRADTVAELGEILTSVNRAGGVVLIPAFAVGRSQEILYQLGKHHRTWGLAGWRVFLDSPLAIKTSRIYWDYPHLYDDEATRLRRNLDPMPLVEGLTLSRSREDSMAINQIEDRAIVIAGSGMLNGGRILHHLKQRLRRSDTHLIIAGYQPSGSLGRRLIDRAQRVRIHGQRIPVGAQVHTLGGLSAHGDQQDLLRWYGAFKNAPPLFLVHGNPEGAEAFVAAAAAAGARRVYPAKPGRRLDLTAL